MNRDPLIQFIQTNLPTANRQTLADLLLTLMTVSC